MSERISKVQREEMDAMLKSMASGGRLTPQAVLEEAESAESPLHGWFEWDDTVAAAAYRLDQARDLIRSVEVTLIVEDRPIDVAYFVRDPEKESDQQGYVTLDKLRKSPAHAKMHLQAELRAVLAALKRAEGYAQILQLTELLEQARASVRRLSARIDSKPLQ